MALFKGEKKGGIEAISKGFRYFWNDLIEFNWLLMIYSIFCTTKVSPIRDHVTFKLPYDFSYHMKTP